MKREVDELVQINCAVCSTTVKGFDGILNLLAILKEHIDDTIQVKQVFYSFEKTNGILRAAPV